MKIFIACIAMCIVLLSISHADPSQYQAGKSVSIGQDGASQDQGSPLFVRSQKMIDVFKPDGSLQCEGGGQRLEDARRELEEGGVSVHSADKRHDGKMRIQVCGAPTGQILVMTIPSKHLGKAEALGYSSMPKVEQG